MSDKILSVGLDIGTATTQLILSELTIENIASVFTIPRVYITDKKVLYKSEIIFTPISDQLLIEVDKIKNFVLNEYAKAGIQKKDIQMGAVIITGETLSLRRPVQTLRASLLVKGPAAISILKSIIHQSSILILVGGLPIWRSSEKEM